MKTGIVNCVVVLGLLFGIGPLRAAQPTRDAMRAKLDYARGTLEGLITARFEMISTNAVQLRNLSQTNAYTLTSNPDYKRFSTNFARNVDRLIEAAKAENLERAASAYSEVTRGCIECHKVFRREQFLKAQQKAMTP